MKFICTFALFALLLACSSKPTTEGTVSDTTSVVQDSIVTLSSDTVKVAEALEPVKPAVEEVKAEKKDPSKKVLLCQFKSLETDEATGCLHIIFDSGDFGTAVTGSLPVAQKKLWESLMTFEGHGDWPGANPEYVGKTFEITHNYTLGDACERNASGEAIKKQVPNILSFKQIAN